MGTGEMRERVWWGKGIVEEGDRGKEMVGQGHRAEKKIVGEGDRGGRR